MSSTFAPAASNFCLISSASFLFTPAFTSLGAPSTKSLASFKPKDVTPLISFITLIFLSPADAKKIENSDFSSPAGAAAPPAGAAATGAAAVTPHFSSRIFARSASDAKGPVMMIINALEIMKRNNIELEYNLKVIMDFEEEISSPNLADAVKKYSSKLKSDALLIFDGPKHPSNLPTLTFGARGISDITLITYGPIVPQHSGHFGNYAPNPVFRMSEILSSMKDPNGRVTIPGFYDGIELDKKTLKILAEVPDDEKKMMNDMHFKKPDNVGKNYQESIQYPSINVRGIESGWVREEVRTIVPSECIAEIDVRLVLESDPIRLHNLIKSHIQELGYYVINRRPTKDERLKHNKIVTFVSSFDYDAFRTDIQSEIGKWLVKSLKKTFGIEPVKKRTSGGSVPISPFVNTLGIPAVTVPTVNQDNNQHSPNENIKIENYITGIETYLGILTDKF